MRIGFGLVFLAGSLVSAQSSAQAPRPSVFGVTVYCTLPGKGAMGVGWTEPHEGKYYRCLPTFDENFKPSGASWVRVQQNGTIGDSTFTK
jgi:hypothetical protein